MRYRGEDDFLKDVVQMDEAMDDWRRYREQISLRDLLDHRDTQNMVLFAMLVTIQAAIRTAHHLIIGDYLPKPGTYEETFTILRKAGVLDADTADAMARLSVYRQKLISARPQLDLRDIYEVLVQGMQTLETYRAKLEKRIAQKK